jgi:5-methylcytosine-specific restriction endonuclease McrA
VGRAVTTTADPLRRVCSAVLSHHRARARKDSQQLDYGLAELERLARRSPCCAYCGCVLTPGTLSFDHATPTARAANYSFSNLVACCGGCNLAKGAGMNAQEFKSLLSLLKTFHPRAHGDVLGRLRSGGRRYRGL